MTMNELTPQEAHLQRRVNQTLLRLVEQEDLDAPAFDAALAQLQGLIGQTSGDVAGQHFAGQQEAWREATKAERLERLSRYLDAEFADVEATQHP